jgi:hypothetical protein
MRVICCGVKGNMLGPGNRKLLLSVSVGNLLLILLGNDSLFYQIIYWIYNPN